MMSGEEGDILMGPTEEIVDAENVDVVIIGGGMAGLSTAHAIKKCKPTLKVKILEAKG